MLPAAAISQQLHYYFFIQIIFVQKDAFYQLRDEGSTVRSVFGNQKLVNFYPALVIVSFTALYLLGLLFCRSFVKLF